LVVHEYFVVVAAVGGWFVSFGGSRFLFWFRDSQCRGGKWLVVVIIIGVGLLLFVAVWTRLVVFLVQKDLKQGIIIIVITVQCPTTTGKENHLRHRFPLMTDNKVLFVVGL
jgi:hypothetical protein